MPVSCHAQTPVAQSGRICASALACVHAAYWHRRARACMMLATARVRPSQHREPQCSQSMDGMEQSGVASRRLGHTCAVRREGHATAAVRTLCRHAAGAAARARAARPGCRARAGRGRRAEQGRAQRQAARHGDLARKPLRSAQGRIRSKARDWERGAWPREGKRLDPTTLLFPAALSRSHKEMCTCAHLSIYNTVSNDQLLRHVAVRQTTGQVQPAPRAGAPRPGWTAARPRWPSRTGPARTPARRTRASPG